MVLIKMSSNAKPEKQDMAIMRSPVLPQTSFENPILLSSPSNSSDEGVHQHSTPPTHNLTTHLPSANSSLCGSTRSERFCLTGEFSSFDSDVFVSATSDSSEDEAMPCQPLSELRKLITRNKSTVTKCSQYDDLTMIVLSNSPSDDITDSSDPLFQPPSPSNRSPSKHDLPQSLIVRVPLHLVTVQQTKSHVPTIQKGKRPLALSHFATLKKRAINDITNKDADTLPIHDVAKPLKQPPLSLKLTKSPTGNNWCSTPPTGTSHSSPPQLASLSRNSSNYKKTSPCKTNVSSAVPEPTALSNCDTSTNGERTPLADIRTDELPLVTRPPNNLLHSDDILSLTGNSSFTGNSTNGSYQPLPCKGLPAKKRRRTTKPVTNIKNVKSTICFDKHFGSYSPDLKYVRGDLQPLHTLSLRNVRCVPSNHPIHSWTVGRPVPKPPRSSHKPHPIQTFSHDHCP